jgi:hypothetical protein
METRADRYRRMGADDKLRAARTNDPSRKRAFEEAAGEWFKLADEVEQMERDRLAPSPPPNRSRSPGR